jgi:hypothetical protein
LVRYYFGLFFHSKHSVSIIFHDNRQKHIPSSYNIELRPTPPSSTLLFHLPCGHCRGQKAKGQEGDTEKDHDIFLSLPVTQKFFFHFRPLSLFLLLRLLPPFLPPLLLLLLLLILFLLLQFPHFFFFLCFLSILLLLLSLLLILLLLVFFFRLL